MAKLCTKKRLLELLSENGGKVIYEMADLVQELDAHALSVVTAVADLFTAKLIFLAGKHIHLEPREEKEPRPL